jgi:putative ABC transport system permease protein
LKKKNNWRWLMKMAWRDARTNRFKLLLFTSSIILGIAALVAINSFRHSLKTDIESQAKELLGADFLVRGNHPPSDSLSFVLDSLGGMRAEERSFSSMIYFPENQGTRLVNVRALEGDFPFYGIIETVPPEAAVSFKAGQTIIADQTLMIQYDARNADTAQIGLLDFRIEGQLVQAPGQSGISATVAPPVYMPLAYLKETGLDKKGSRISYRYYFKFEEGRDIDAIVERLEPLLKNEGMRYDTVEKRKEDLGGDFQNLAGFLNLVGFFALLLGSVGVASSVHLYVKEKINHIAVLRCLGMKGNQSVLIFLIQILFMGLMGSLVGATLGALLQFYLPLAVKDFLPFEATFRFSLPVTLEGIGAGLVVTLLFALIPLLAVRKVSPLKTIRTEYEPQGFIKDPLTWFLILLIAAFIFFFGYWQMGFLKDAITFSGFVFGSFIVLTGFAYLVIWMVKKYFPRNWNFVMRQGLANLYRPNNQTLILIISIGLGTALITTLMFIQSILVNQVTLTEQGERPNLILFDIQSDQKAAAANITRENGLPVMMEVPVVTMRLNKIRGEGKRFYENETDTTEHISGWVFDREYRVTYRKELIESEESWEGAWSGTYSGSGPVPISIEKDYAERMTVALGDRLLFNVQGALMEAEVAHLRSVDWKRIQSNFLVLFPENVLEQAPQFHVLMTRAASPEQSASYQQAIVQAFPNVSAIDITLILNTVDEILSKVAFVIRFMALFSIATGIIVLIGSVILSRLQKIKDSVLLRTLGASRSKILNINLVEYFLLGNLAAFTGILLALLGSWGISYYSFEVAFVPDLLPAVYIYLGITALTTLIGQTNNRKVLNNPPLEVLRKEVS